MAFSKNIRDILTIYTKTQNYYYSAAGERVSTAQPAKGPRAGRRSQMKVIFTLKSFEIIMHKFIFQFFLFYFRQVTLDMLFYKKLVMMSKFMTHQTKMTHL